MKEEHFLDDTERSLTDAQLYQKVYREFKAIQQVELDLLKQYLPRVIKNSRLPRKWRRKTNKSLYKFMLWAIQIDWAAKEPKEAAEFERFRQIYFEEILGQDKKK